MMFRAAGRIAGGIVLGIMLVSAVAQPMHGDDAPISAGEDRSLHELEFLHGTWQGTMGEGEFVEEIWSEAKGGAMMGMFRWLNAEGQPRLYEMLSICREGDEVLLRLRHFTAKMIAWEQRESPVVLRLAEIKPRRAEFVSSDPDNALNRIVFFTTAENTLGIDVQFTEDSGEEALNFRMTRFTP